MNYKDIVSLLDKNCKPFIKEMKSGKNFLIRMSPKYAIKQDIIVSSPRKNRNPTDTPYHIHKEMDEMLDSKFGWKPRSEGLFAWIAQRKGGSDNYWFNNKGSRLVFPVGSYRYVYSPKVKDVYNKYEHFQETADYGGGRGNDPIEVDKEIDTNFLDWFWDDALPTYTNKDFAKVNVSKEHIELMLLSSVVYLLNPELIPLLNDEYKLDISEGNWDRPNYEMKRKVQSETPEISKRRYR
jgi:hypothetical protein